MTWNEVSMPPLLTRPVGGVNRRASLRAAQERIRQLGC